LFTAVRKPLRQVESASLPTMDVRHCSPRLSSNCRQLNTRTLCIRGTLIHESARLSDTRTCCAGGLRARSTGRVSGRQRAGFMQDAVYEFPRTPQPVEKVVVGPVGSPKEARNKAKTLRKRRFQLLVRGLKRARRSFSTRWPLLGSSVNALRSLATREGDLTQVGPAPSSARRR
jgi:hypothetical protein